MSQANDVSALLQQYRGDTGVKSVQKVEKDFVEVAQQVPTEEVSNGLSQAFRSEQTPPLGETVGQSFEQSDPQQRADMLNQLLDAAGSAAKPLMEKTEGATVVDPATAQQIAPELVQQIVHQAEQENPQVVEKISSLYAEDPSLVKTLDGATLSVALGKIAEDR